MTIAILLLLPKALLQGSHCNTIAITIGNILCLIKTKDFHTVLVLNTSSVEILFESHTIAVIFDELGTY